MAFTRITVDPLEMGGAPCIRHLHIPVAAIVDRVAEGQGVEDVLEEYPGLETEDVREALQYAAEVLRKLKEHVRELSGIVAPALGEQQRLAAEGHTETGGAAFLRRIEDLKKRHGGGVEFEPPRLHFVPVDPFAREDTGNG